MEHCYVAQVCVNDGGVFDFCVAAFAYRFHYFDAFLEFFGEKTGWLSFVMDSEDVMRIVFVVVVSSLFESP